MSFLHDIAINDNDYDNEDKDGKNDDYDNVNSEHYYDIICALFLYRYVSFFFLYL
jgi:hypothetical protein